MVFWSDASKIGLSFVFAGNGFFYEISADPEAPRVDIFFLELVAIMSAVAFAADLKTPPRRVLLYSDSLDSVDVFNSLAAKNSSHNAPLLAVSAIVLRTGFDIRVRHIPGRENIRADLLSRLLLEDFHLQFPSYRVSAFVPPRDLLPARWRRSF
ncbi:hypothetical protein F5878DRAFT_548413 [Lentinula raphanica]|uniref:Uncharacterized protein n=1 Tax=Lentinula raphanica TaxID=153919 RepID=A0AA38NX64_9AGAR|nr:hypothetical protein EV360DRAFT_56748 [Lentinula raphanica]KAJ3832278.1 hypothetical protein F5878DRAFT_548413 [Lentinula raphanica]